MVIIHSDNKVYPSSWEGVHVTLMIPCIFKDDVLYLGLEYNIIIMLYGHSGLVKKNMCAVHI